MTFSRKPSDRNGSGCVYAINTRYIRNSVCTVVVLYIRAVYNIIAVGYECDVDVDDDDDDENNVRTRLVARASSFTYNCIYIYLYMKLCTLVTGPRRNNVLARPSVYYYYTVRYMYNMMSATN